MWFLCLLLIIYYAVFYFILLFGKKFDGKDGYMLCSSTLTTTTPALAATAGIALPTGVPPVVGLPGSSAFSVDPKAPLVKAVGAPSECLLLKNMFDPTIEVNEILSCFLNLFMSSPTFDQMYLVQTGPDFDLDIKEDVQDECAKFGNLKHIFVDK